MFKVVENPEFTRKVTVAVPVDGGFENQILGVRFRVLSQDRINEIMEASPGNYMPLVGEMVADLHDLADADGKPMACNDQVRAAVLDKTYVRTAILMEYNQAIAGAKRGN